MEEKVSILVVEVKGKGCRGCILPSKRLFFNVKGVKGVQTLGNLIAIIYDNTLTSSLEILSESHVQEFYDVKVILEKHNVPLSNVKDCLKKIMGSHSSINVRDIL